MLQLVLTVTCKVSNGFSLPASELFSFSGTVNLPCSWALLHHISLKSGGNYFKSIVA